MKKLLLAFFLLQAGSSWAQSVVLDRQSKVHFRASKETFVPVKADNHQASVIIDLKNGQLASVLLVREFVFKNALMQEHFNENYMESDVYPKITFQGTINDFDASTLEPVPKAYPLTGTFTIHGVERELSVVVLLSKRGSVIELSSNFTLKPEDFKIKIPKIVRYKIAKEVIVTLTCKLTST